MVYCEYSPFLSGGRGLLTGTFQRPEVQKAYAEMVKIYGLNPQYLNIKNSWAMANWAICRWWDVNMSMAKARKFGYFGMVDWTDSIGAVFQEMVHEKIIPPIQV